MLYYIIDISAAIHDLNHVGRTNGFLVSSRDDLALQFNDISVGENYTLATFFESDKDGSTFSDLCSELSAEDKMILRKRIIKLVHATDTEKNFRIINKLKLRLAAGNFNPKHEADDKCNDDMELLLRFIMRCADLSYSLRPFETSKMWAKRLSEEFFAEGDEGRQFGLEPTKYADRNKKKFEELQVIIIKALALPLWTLWSQYTKDNTMEKMLRKNLKIWKDLRLKRSRSKN